MAVLTREREPVHIAVCDDDRCPWKHRGVTEVATRIAAGAHVREVGHAVTLYEDHHNIGSVARYAR